LTVREELEATYSPSSAALSRPGADEQLADHRAAGAGDRARMLGAHGHLTPAQEKLPLRAHGLLEQAHERRARLLVGGQEAHQHPIEACGRQLEVDGAAQQLVGHLH